MKIALLRIILSSAFGALLAPLAFAQNCNSGAFNWSATVPSINVRHVFCGEINQANNRVVGFHSRRGLNAPVNNVQVDHNYPNGLYEAWVTFNNGRSKWSTMFPDACTYDQVLNSIVYAANNLQPAGNLPWGQWGWSADGTLPPHQNADKCLGSDGQPFGIRMASPNNQNRINTAFPWP